MSNTIVLWACLIAIILVIVAYNMWRVNMGIAAMAFAFIIGCVLQGEKAATIYKYWPDNLVFFLLACSLFFEFASENGALLVFGKKLLYRFRNNLKLIPWVMFVITAILAFLGAGTASQVLIAPISYAIGLQIGMDPLMTVCAVSLGYTVGTYNPWTGMGVQMIGFVENNGVATEIAVRTATANYCTTLVKQCVTMAVCYFFFNWLTARKRKAAGEVQSFSAKNIEIEKPEEFNPVQKKTFVLIVLSFLILVIPNMLNTWFKFESPIIQNLILVCQPHSIFLIFAMIASVMKLADTKEVIKRLPMNTILLVAGVCFLMEIAKAAGMVEVIEGLFGSSVPKFLVGPFLCLIAGILSIFSSTWSVVLPLMYPLVPPLAAATGLNPVGLYSAILFGSNATGFSPFSTAGSMLVGLAPDELREAMIPRMIVLAVAMLVLTMVLGLFGMYDIFNFMAR